MSETYFIREKKDKNYTVVDNTYIKDSSLSWKAKGLFTYILSLPEDWKIYMSELVNHSTGGKEELKSIIKELVQHGYIQRDKSKDEKGMFVGWSYEIIEQPESVFTRERENRQSESPTSGNTPLLSTNPILSTNEQSTTPSKPKRIKKEKEEKKPYGTFKNVFLSDTEYNSLKEAYTENVLLAGIEAVSVYVQGKPEKHYSNFNKVMLTWGIDAGKESIQSGKYRPIQNTTSIGDFNVECCGQKISRYRPFCIKCGKQFNMDGTEK